MSLTPRNGISVVQIFVFTNVLSVATYLAYRDGFDRSPDWVFLVAFSMLRIIGAGMQLGEGRDSKNIGLYIAAAICQNVGLAPLLLTTLGLISRLWDSIDIKKPHWIRKFFQLTQVLTLVAMLIGILGGVDAGIDYAKHGHKFTHTPTNSKVAGILFIVAFAMVVAAMIWSATSIHHIEAGEKRLLLVLLVSLPLLFLRLLYSCFSNFDKAPKWNALTGDVPLLICLAVIEEMIVVLLYVAVGRTLKVKVRDVKKSPGSKKAWVIDTQEP